MKKQRYEGTLGYLFRNNETFLLASTFIFLVSLMLGYAFSGLLESLLNPLMDEFRRSVAEGELKLTTPSIFIHNLQAALLIYGGGLIMGIFTAFFLVINGLFIGYFGTKVPLGDFVLLTLPHGIFEIPGLVIAGAAGFRLSSFIYNFFSQLFTESWYGPLTDKILYFFGKNREELNESLMLFGIALALLLLAAVIEANVTLAIYSFIKASF